MNTDPGTRRQWALSNLPDGGALITEPALLRHRGYAILTAGMLTTAAARIEAGEMIACMVRVGEFFRPALLTDAHRAYDEEVEAECYYADCTLLDPYSGRGKVSSGGAVSHKITRRTVAVEAVLGASLRACQSDQPKGAADFSTVQRSLPRASGVLPGEARADVVERQLQRLETIIHGRSDEGKTSSEVDRVEQTSSEPLPVGMKTRGVSPATLPAAKLTPEQTASVLSSTEAGQDRTDTTTPQKVTGKPSPWVGADGTPWGLIMVVMVAMMLFLLFIALAPSVKPN